jgi:hypothetical protein
MPYRDGKPLTFRHSSTHSIMNHRVQDIINTIYSNYPDVVDAWEIAAIVESLGYTDTRIQAEFGCPNALILSQFIYDQRTVYNSNSALQEPIAAAQMGFKQKPESELKIFITQFSHSFVYTIPFIIILFLGYLKIDREIEILPHKLTSLFATATMASLITSGGFIQMIARRGGFYFGLNDPIQANRVCTPILWLGIFTSVCLGIFGIFFGFYQNIAADEYIIIAGIYYVMVSITWILFAAISLNSRWIAVAILIGITLLFAGLRLTIKLGAIECQLIVMFLAFMCLAILTAIEYFKNRPQLPQFGKLVELPSLSVSIYLLAPYFSYGVIYFAFIFADRLAAGLSSYSTFNLYPATYLDYQDHMDLALLDLLTIVPAIEYFSFKLITYWYKQSKSLSIKQIETLPKKLKRRYRSLVLRTAICFFILMTGSIFLSLMLNPHPIDRILTICGCIGYLFFAIGLLNSIVLLSLDRLPFVLQSIIPATVINFILAYLCGNLFGVYFAVVGLIIGGIFFAVSSGTKVLQAFSQADYCYFYSGY